MSRMQILVDGIVFENSSQIGIWRVFYETIRRTSRDIDYTILLCQRPKQPLPEGVRVEQSSHRRVLRRRNVPGRILRRVSAVNLERRYPDAVWHSTFYSLDPRRCGKSVVTVYDMIAEKHFALVGGWAQQQRDQKLPAISRADKAIAISNTTAADLIRFFGEWEGKVAVMPLGAEHIRSESLSIAVGNSSSAVLYVGSRGGYKNYGSVVEALSLKQWPTGLRLRVVGPPFSEMETDLHRYYGVSDSIDHVGRVSDAQLADEYRRAVCFIFPSIAEGFGIPVLESQANSCVALLSDTSIFREIAGEGALFFDPHDCRSICDAACRSRDARVREAVLMAAKDNLTRFSWDDAARAVANVYSSIF